ncbi:type II toxin-antitoxin system VapC family toxin [Streptomonospora sp. PA3]|uniref:type II toxin-antitoxin system VapC family toxin n=1 Tax=Streptomonospora sp. PA3 TaxID=2607326 RepID=UPI0012DF03FF|nr:type II toxin-antitoxin system VapC family toxin [Streptomonospora sp. PA3]MUL40212.1 type II toxin-antitoxin system VapC family toxin [Streptomonospora sp. PA3]
MSCVVDCSIVIRLLAAHREDELLRRRLTRRVHAPELIDAEVSSVIRGLSMTAKPATRISDERARTMLTRYRELHITRYPMVDLQFRCYELRHNLTAYDAMYVALAEALDLPLLTDDAKIAKASGHRARILHHPRA